MPERCQRLAQLDPLGDLLAIETLPGKTDRLVVEQAVEVALLAEELRYLVAAPRWPVVASKEHLSTPAEKFDRIVQAL